MDRIAISETALTKRIETSFFKNENSFWQATKQKVPLEKCLIADLTNRIAISVPHATRIWISFSQNEDSLLQEMR